MKKTEFPIYFIKSGALRSGYSVGERLGRRHHQLHPSKIVVPHNRGGCWSVTACC
jgi:hypothetical protein